MSNTNSSSRGLVAAKAGIAMVAFISVMGSAEAKVAHGNCSAGSEKLSAATTYHKAGHSAYKVTRVAWKIDNKKPNRPAKNNMYIALRGYGGHVTYWQWTSGDNVREGHGHRSLSVTVPKKSNPYVKYVVVFDKKHASDPSCGTYTRLT